MEKFCVTAAALVMFVAFICSPVIAAPRKVTKPAQTVEKTTEMSDSAKTTTINKQDNKVNASPVVKAGQAGETKSITGTAK